MKWQFELFRTLFPQTTDRFCGSLPYHLQFSKPFLEYKYWHWFCYLNTSFTKVAVRSDFSLLLPITAFPFSCPFGTVRHGELLLSSLCSPTRAVWCYSLPDDLVWKRASGPFRCEHMIQFALCDGPLSILSSLSWREVKTIPSQRDVTAIIQSTLATPFVWRLVRWKMGKGTSRVLAVTAEHACTYLPYATQTYLLLFVFLLIFVSSEFIIAVQTFSKKFTGVRQGSFAVLSWQFS